MIRFGLGAINSENMLTSNTATWTKQDQMVATVWAALKGGEHYSCMEGLCGDGLTTWCVEGLSYSDPI